MQYPSQTDPLDLQMDKIGVEVLQPQSILDSRLTDFYTGFKPKQGGGNLYQFSANPSNNLQHIQNQMIMNEQILNLSKNKPAQTQVMGTMTSSGRQSQNAITTGLHQTQT